MEPARKLNKHYTYADYSSWPEDERCELINGMAYTLSTPTRAHQSALLEMARQIGNFLREKPCKVFVAPFSVRLNADEGDDTVVEPDILVVCDEKKIADGKGVVGAPDLIIEILSPSTAKHDRLTKFALYQRSGVREYWIVDTDISTVTVNVLFHDVGYVSRAYGESDTAVPVEVLEGCTMNLADVFVEP